MVAMEKQLKASQILMWLNKNIHGFTEQSSYGRYGNTAQGQSNPGVITQEH